MAGSAGMEFENDLEEGGDETVEKLSSEQLRKKIRYEGLLLHFLFDLNNHFSFKD